MFSSEGARRAHQILLIRGCSLSIDLRVIRKNKRCPFGEAGGQNFIDNWIRGSQILRNKMVHKIKHHEKQSSNFSQNDHGKS